PLSPNCTGSRIIISGWPSPFRSPMMGTEGKFPRPIESDCCVKVPLPSPRAKEMPPWPLQPLTSSTRSRFPSPFTSANATYRNIKHPPPTSGPNFEEKLPVPSPNNSQAAINKLGSPPPVTRSRCPSLFKSPTSKCLQHEDNPAPEVKRVGVPKLPEPS